jgi:hypothetical protein
VVALAVDAARAARDNAQRLRVDACTLRSAAQQNLHVATVRRERAAATARVRGAGPVGSAWSDLEWLRESDALGHVLELVD